MKKHIAKTGAKAGQWVNCSAKQCRNGGTHVEAETFYAAHQWLQRNGNKVLIKEVNAQHIKNFSKEPSEVQEKWADFWEDVKKNRDERFKANQKRITNSYRVNSIKIPSISGVDYNDKGAIVHARSKIIGMLKTPEGVEYGVRMYTREEMKEISAILKGYENTIANNSIFAPNIAARCIVLTESDKQEIKTNLYLRYRGQKLSERQKMEHLKLINTYKKDMIEKMALGSNRRIQEQSAEIIPTNPDHQKYRTPLPVGPVKQAKQKLKDLFSGWSVKEL